MESDVTVRMRGWQAIAAKVLACRACSFIRTTRAVVHPDAGWGNLYAPIFAIGINSNWGFSRDEFPHDLQKAGDDPQYKLVSRYWDSAGHGADATRFFEASPPCSDPGELRSRLEGWQKGVVGDRPQYECRVFDHLSDVLRDNGGVTIDSATSTIEKRVALWNWVYYANAVRCPSGAASEIPPEEFRHCFWQPGAPGNVLQEELRLVRPSMLVVLGHSAIRNQRGLGEDIESQLGELLGMACRNVQDVEVPDATSRGAASFRICEYEEASSRFRLQALLLPHPNWPVRLAFNKRVRDAISQSWLRCGGSAPAALCCVNLPA
jgi:hypothetical protein